MSEKSKLITLTPNIGSFDYDGKKFYNHVLVFENGVSGQSATISQDGSPWKAGEEFEFEVAKDKQGNNRIKKAGGGGVGGGRASYKRNEKLESASVALSYSKDLAVDKIIPVDQVLVKAEEFRLWLIEKGEVQ